MSEPSSRSLEVARELVEHYSACFRPTAVYAEINMRDAIALALDAARAERDAEWKEWLYSSDPAGTPAFRALKEAVAEERERCAQIADKFTEPRILAMWNRPGGPPGNAYVPLRGKHIAAAIRAENIGESEGEDDR